MYVTHACTSHIVTLYVNNSLPIRRYNNSISFSDMLDDSVSSLNLWLFPECGEQPGIDISLMMCGRFFVSFQETIGIDVSLSMNG